MDPIMDDDEKTPSASELQNEDESPHTLQINPLSLMTSTSPFRPVEDDDETHKSTDLELLRARSTDAALSSSNLAEQYQQTQQTSGIHMDDRSISAWVEATTNETVSPSLERSPSLPSSLLEPIAARSRGNST